MYKRQHLHTRAPHISENAHTSTRKTHARAHTRSLYPAALVTAPLSAEEQKLADLDAIQDLDRVRCFLKCTCVHLGPHTHTSPYPPLLDHTYTHTHHTRTPMCLHTHTHKEPLPCRPCGRAALGRGAEAGRPRCHSGPRPGPLLPQVHVRPLRIAARDPTGDLRPHGGELGQVCVRVCMCKCV